jgi:hypothetical protein
LEEANSGTGQRSPHLKLGEKRLNPVKDSDFEFQVKSDAYIAALIRNFGLQSAR